MLTVELPEELLRAVGSELGVTRWRTVDQERIDLFADATDDHQWIHVDKERATTSRFGGTIAHGFLSLSLLSPFLEELLEIRGASMLMNYGLNKVRFPRPFPSEAG